MLKRALLTITILTTAALLPQVARVKNAEAAAENQTASESSPRTIYTTSADEQDVKDEFHQTYPLGANGRILLDNLNGGVKIKVWDRAEVQVDAVKRAFNRERLEEAKIEIAASMDLLRIKTIYPDYNRSFSDGDRRSYQNPAVVDYTLTVPRQVRLESIELVNGPIDIDGVEGYVKATSVNGRVAARGLAGDAKLSTVNGSLEADFSRLEGITQITLGSVNGNLLLVIPSNANAVLRASTVHGDIGNEFGLEVQHGDYVGHELYAQIGSGGPRIKLENVNGTIRIKHAKDGGQLNQATSLLSQKRDKERGEAYIDQEERERIRQEAREQAQEVREEARAAAQEARERAIAQAVQDRQLDAETRREVDRALREAQREIKQAQVEVEREVRREIRERARAEARGAGAGEGTGTGVGGGVGGGIGGALFTEKETKTFAVTGTPRVNVSTDDGTVIVHGWDKSEVMYTATKRANQEEELKAILIKTGQQGSNISIVANANDADGSTSLEVYLPRNASLTVSSGDGRLSLNGVSGDLTLRTGDGAVDVANGNGHLLVNTGDGPIKIARFDGQVEARTGDGPVSLDGRFTGVQVRTGSGSVTLAVPADLSFIVETNAEEVTNEGLTILEDVAPSKRVRRWKVGQGGQVFVINTGEGRLLLRSR